MKKKNETALNPSTKKLLEALRDSMVLTEGKVQTNNNGVRYRYDHYKNKYKHTPYWLKLLWEKAVVENKEPKYSTQFSDGPYQFAFKRAVFKSEKDGPIGYSQLIILDDNKKPTGLNGTASSVKKDSLEEFLNLLDAKPMVDRKKNKTTKKTQTMKKKVTIKGVAGKKKTAAKKKKSTGLNGPASATKTVRVSKAAGTRADGTLKKGHRYVKGGGIVKITKK